MQNPLELAIEQVKEGILKKIEEEKREQERRVARAKAERGFFEHVRTTLEVAISQLADVKYNNTESTIRFVYAGKERSIHVGYHCFEDNWENRFDALGISFEMGDRRRQFRDTDLAEGLKEFLLHIFRIEIESLCHERLCNSQTNS